MLWKFREYSFDLAVRPLVMGIVNVTPDSFSDGGQFFDPMNAVNHGIKLVEQGADILDIGGESSRPGSQPVTLDEELRRVVAVVRELAKVVKVPISVDTTKPEVARQCLAAGASVINDINGLRAPGMPEIAAEFGAGVIAMHMQGTPATMQQNPHYDDVIREVHDFFDERMVSLTNAGIREQAISLDPGIGFGKSTAHNLKLIHQLKAFHTFDRPITLGVSRKGFFGSTLGKKLPDRTMASLAVASFAIAKGSAHIFRVHDVEPTCDAVRLWEAMEKAG